jgi:energy-coupling factor transporter ATP-binding protein EcfA2
MRIVTLDFPQSITEGAGLQPIKAVKTSVNVVTLVGRNGSGKSRLLKLLNGYKYGNYKTLLNMLDEIPSEIPEIISGIDMQYDKLEKTFVYRENQKARKYTKLELEEFKLKIEKEATARITSILSSHIKFIDLLAIREVEAKLDPDYNFDEMLSKSSTSLTNDNLIGSLGRHGLNYIKKISVNALGQEYNETKGIRNKKDTELRQCKILESYIVKLFGKQFQLGMDSADSTIKAQLLLDNHELSIESLSPGERSLFALAILFTTLEINSNNDLSNCIIVIDEPETHLHPDAQIRVLEELRKLVTPHGQLWIATHSIHIISNLQYDEIFLMKNGQLFTPNRSIPGESIIELMGIQRRIDELKQFINSVSSWAYSNFMVQCFQYPKVIANADKDDKQIKAIKNLLKAESIKFLDFGAGEGRVGHSLFEDKKLAERIQYFAFEPEEVKRDRLRKQGYINECYGEIEEIPLNYFDVVVLCNVLHEITPEDWPKLFNDIKSVLVDGGFCLIVEDKIMPKGENAHKYGFLLLNETAIHSLFRGANTYLVFPEESNALSDRILSACIFKEGLNVTESNVRNSMDILNQILWKELVAMRLENEVIDDAANGRLYALKSQLYINSSLAMRGLGSYGKDNKSTND